MLGGFGGVQGKVPCHLGAAQRSPGAGHAGGEAFDCRPFWPARLRPPIGACIRRLRMMVRCYLRDNYIFGTYDAAASGPVRETSISLYLQFLVDPTRCVGVSSREITDSRIAIISRSFHGVIRLREKKAILNGHGTWSKPRDPRLSVSTRSTAL